ncbi:MAG: alpha/beta hydrolase, partial [Microcystaceae cyanobacterium]
MNRCYLYRRQWLKTLSAFFSLSLGLLAPGWQPSPAYSAEKLHLVYGPLDFSLSVSSLDTYAKTGKITKDLQFFTQFLSSENLEQFRKLLQKRFSVDQVTAYKISRTSLAEDFLRELGQVFQTHPERNGFYALRGAIVSAAANPEGWTVVDVMQQFPTDSIIIDVDSILELKAQLEAFSSYRQAAVQAISQQANREASAPPSVDLTQLPDLRQPGPYSFSQKNITVEKEELRQTHKGLVGRYHFDVDLYIPQNVGKPAPLVVISHGFGSLKENFTQLAEHLASYGFAVAIPEHIGSDLTYRQELLQGKLSSALSPIEYLDRPLDITYLLDELEQLAAADSTWAKQIDLQATGIIGDSLGATTALSLAGAEVNTARLEQECDPERIIINLSLLLQCQARYLPPLNFQLRDPRIKAVIASHPLASGIFGPEGMGEIQIPTLIVAGSNDIITPVTSEQIHPFIWLNALNKYLLLFEPGTHFTSSEPSLKFQADTIPKALIGDNRALGSRYFRGISVAF